MLKNVQFDQIVATKFVNYKNSIYERFLNYTKLSQKQEQELALKLPADSLIFEKTSYEMLEKDFDVAFDKDDEVYICGTDYDACVLAIAFQLFDNGIQPHILLNCVGSHSRNPISKEDFEKICLKNFGINAILK